MNLALYVLTFAAELVGGALSICLTWESTQEQPSRASSDPSQKTHLQCSPALILGTPFPCSTGKSSSSFRADTCSCEWDLVVLVKGPPLHS